MVNDTTVEGKAKMKNGVKRLMFCGVAILLQLIFCIRRGIINGFI